MNTQQFENICEGLRHAMSQVRLYIPKIRIQDVQQVLQSLPQLAPGSLDQIDDFMRLAKGDELPVQDFQLIKQALADWKERDRQEAAKQNFNLVAAVNERRFSEIVDIYISNPEFRPMAVDALKSSEPVLWLRRVHPHQDARSTLGHLGGKPSLSSSDDWPRDRDGHRAFFVGQLDCAEINALMPGNLPAEGVLCFFIDWDMEKGWDDQGAKPCYVLHVTTPSGAPTIPADYHQPPNVFPPVGMKFVELEHDSRELQPRLWAQMDFEAIRILMMPGFVEPPHASARDAREFSIEFKHIAREYRRAAIDGQRGERPRTRDLVCPGTRALPDRSACELSGFPWAGVYIATLAQEVLRRVNKEISECVSNGLSALDFNALGFHSRYRVPELPSPRHALERASAWAAEHTPQLALQMQYWLELERLAREALGFFDQFIDRPMDEPSEAEKRRFVDWLAAWINMGDSRNGRNYPHPFEAEGPVHELAGALPPNDTHNPQQSFGNFYRFRLADALATGLRNATAQIASNHAVARRVPNEVLNVALGLSEQSELHHWALGPPMPIQDEGVFRNKVLLLQVEDDRTLFSNLGGLLYFIIDPEDLAQHRFDKVQVVSQCD